VNYFMTTQPHRNGAGPSSFINILRAYSLSDSPIALVILAGFFAIRNQN
jgi:cytosine/uracil/thiamine/allantoin permease